MANPCGVDRDGCEQICILSHRSDNQGLGYRCRCRMGYDLHADGKRCVGKANTQTLFRFFPINIGLGTLQCAVSFICVLYTVSAHVV